MATKKPKLSEADKDHAFLTDFVGGEWFFPKGYAREFRAVALTDRGLLERTMRVYRMSAGGANVEYRSCYRLTDAGRAHLASKLAAEASTG